MNRDSIEAFLHFATRMISGSRSQLLQDLWVLWEHSGRPPGVFLDIGAADGHYLSNTLLLETLGWTGILVEPNANYYPTLAKRGSPALQKCVWDRAGECLKLRSVTGNLELSRLSVITELDHLDQIGARDSFTEFDVMSTTIEEIISDYNISNVIDYMSVDIEGAELNVLSSIDYNKYKFRCLSVEHNFTPSRDKIHDLLAENGYVRKWPQISGWDDWYIHGDFVEAMPKTSREPMDRLAQLWVEIGNIPEADRVNLAISNRWEPPRQTHDPAPDASRAG